MSWAYAAPPSNTQKFDFDIKPGALADELRGFYDTTRAQMLYDSRLEMIGRGLQGRYTAEEALVLLLQRTGLICEYVHGGQNFIIRRSTDRHSPTTCSRTLGRLAADGEGPRPSAKEMMEEVEVEGSRLGTHIHGISQIGSTLLAWDREQIRRSGAHNVPDLIGEITQNFGGGPNQHTHFGQAETYSNSSLGAGLNLRGLGARATLVLLNGRRIAPSGNAASFVDLLNIPLSAVEAVEVLLDGASAIYGSDAVGGVINIHTKDDYSRPETFAEVGSVTDGHQEQHRLSQDVGARWDGGNLVAVGEVMHRGALSANERWQNNSDLTPRGPDEGDPYSNPGNLVTSLGTYPIPAGQSGRPLDFSTLTPGPPNLANRYAGADIVPDQTRWSLLTSLHQSVNASTTLFSDFLWTQRHAIEREGGQEVELNVTSSPFLLHPPPGEILEQYNLLDDIGPQVAAVDVRTLSATVGLQLHFPGGWHLALSGSDSLETESQVTSGQVDPVALQLAVSSSNPNVAFDPLGSGSHTAASTSAALHTLQWFGSRSELLGFAATADGPVLSLPAGPLRGALGLEFREQRFSMGDSKTDSASDLRRRLYAGFAEMVAPLLDATTYPAPWRDLTLSLAGRIERYSDFGTAATPRLGLTWEPSSHLALRTTWAKSVRVPNLEDLVESNNVSFVQSVGGTPALIWTGGNSKLSVERALTRTIGLHFKADDASPRFTADLNYFDILFRGRIQPSAFPPDILTDPAYASFVIHNPSASARESVCRHSTLLFWPAGNCLQLPIDAIVDLRERNSATLSTDGIDAQLGVSLETSLGTWELGLTSTYILDYKQADTPDVPLTSLLNTLSNPLALHVTGNTTWKIGAAEASLKLKYANRYRDTETQPVSSVAAWTTADLRVAYIFGARGTSGSHPTEVALNCENLFNRYSPFAINNVAHLAYDQENGDLTGRVISLAVDVKW